MAKQLDWRRARKLDLSDPGYKEQRLERAADNWLAYGALDKRPKKAEPKAPEPKAEPKLPKEVRSPNRKPRWRKQARKEVRDLLS